MTDANSKNDPERESIIGKLPERERLMNIWKAQIELHERLRRENGAAVIGISFKPGPKTDADSINEHIIDTLRTDDLFTALNEKTALIDTWGKDLNTLHKKCQEIRNSIPKNKAGRRTFELKFSIVMGIPFLELHQTDTLDTVFHRVLELLTVDDDNPEHIAHDLYMDMPKSDEQEQRLKAYTLRKDDSHHERTEEKRRDLDSEQGYPKLF